MQQWAGILGLAILILGCTQQPDLAQPHHDTLAGEIWGDQTVGQTFVAPQDGLSRIDIKLATYARQNTGPVFFHLREGPTATQDLVTLEFEASQVRDNAYSRFEFAPLPDSADQSFYFFLEAPNAQPGNAISIWASSTDMYKQGQAYQAGRPQPTDLAFQTYHHYPPRAVVQDIINGLAKYADLALLAGLLWLIPGAVVLLFLTHPLPASPGDPPIRDWTSVTLAAGLSIALAPLLFLYISQAGIRLSTGALLGILIVATTATPVLLIRSPFNRRENRQATTPLPFLLLPAVFAITLVGRLLMAKDLVAPMWGDSYHHTLITQLLIDHGRLFQSWEPYVPLRTFTYHFGFHSNVALFRWLTGLSTPKSVIVVGQVLNAMAPLTLYPLVRRLGGTPWAGLLAVLLAGLFSPTPSVYVNWGRYTQLTGLVVLPVAMTLLIDTVESPGLSWRQLALASIAAAGLGLSHYLVSLAFALLVLVYLLWLSGSRLRKAFQTNQDEQVLHPWVRAAVVALLAFAWLSPWISNLQQGILPQILAHRLAPDAENSFFQTQFNAIGENLKYVPTGWIVLATIGGVWGLLQRRPAAIVMSLWTAVLILAANPAYAGLPGTGVINNFTVVIMLYLPLSVLMATGLEGLITLAIQRFPLAQLLLAVGIMGAALLGARLRFMDLDYTFRLVTPADMEAMRWIRDHTTPDTRFLVNGKFAFGGQTVVGEDAGWWIPYLAGRPNTIPPVIYGMEAPQDPQFVYQVEAFYKALNQMPLDDPATAQFLSSRGVTHIYVGFMGGQLLDPITLLQSPQYQLVYEHEGTMIFVVMPASTSRYDPPFHQSQTQHTSVEWGRRDRLHGPQHPGMVAGQVAGLAKM